MCPEPDLNWWSCSAPSCSVTVSQALITHTLESQLAALRVTWEPGLRWPPGHNAIIIHVGLYVWHGKRGNSSFPSSVRQKLESCYNLPTVIIRTTCGQSESLWRKYIRETKQRIVPYIGMYVSMTAYTYNVLPPYLILWIKVVKYTAPRREKSISDLQLHLRKTKMINIHNKIQN